MKKINISKIRPSIELPFWLLILIGSFVTFAVAFASPTFTTSMDSYYGKTSPLKKLTFVATPASNEPNIGGSSDAIFGELLRLTYTVTGTDTSFSLSIHDEDGVAIYSKTDCSTSADSYPASFLIDQNGFTGTRHHGVPVAGPLTVDACNLGRAEIQAMHVISDNNDVNGGTFRIFLNGVNTVPLDFNCVAASLKTALEDMNNIDSVTVTGSGIAGPNDPNTFTVTFGGTLYGHDVNSLSIDCNSLTTTNAGSTFNGVETESQKGEYNITGINLKIYYRDDRY